MYHILYSTSLYVFTLFTLFTSFTLFMVISVFSFFIFSFFHFLGFSHFLFSKADWCECAHELDVELSNEEVEFCIFTFFLKMYRLETRDKELLLSIILDCLYSKKDFKKEYYGYKGSFKFLKEIKNIETSNFKESLNSLINLIENMNVTQKHTTTPTHTTPTHTTPTAIVAINNFNNTNFNKKNFNTNLISPNNDSTNNTNTNTNMNMNNIHNLNRINNNNNTPSDYVYRNKNNLETYTNTTLKESNTNSGEDEINKKFYFKLYVVLKIKYPYGVYIFNCGESYDIVVLDCNTINNNKPKIMSFYSLRKFVSFLNNMYSINYNEEDVYDSFPIIIYESRECYVSTNNHVALKPEVCQSKRQKEKWKVEENSEESENEENKENKENKENENENENEEGNRGKGDNDEEGEEEEEEEEETDEEDEEDDEDDDEQEEENENEK